MEQPISAPQARRHSAGTTQPTSSAGEGFSVSPACSAPWVGARSLAGPALSPPAISCCSAPGLFPSQGDRQGGGQSWSNYSVPGHPLFLPSCPSPQACPYPRCQLPVPMRGWGSPAVLPAQAVVSGQSTICCLPPPTSCPQPFSPEEQVKALPSDCLHQLPEDSSNKKGESAQDSPDARLLQASLLLHPPLTASQPPPTQPSSSRPSQGLLKSHLLYLGHKDGTRFHCRHSPWRRQRLLRAL